MVCAELKHSIKTARSDFNGQRALTWLAPQYCVQIHKIDLEGKCKETPGKNDQFKQ